MQNERARVRSGFCWLLVNRDQWGKVVGGSVWSDGEIHICVLGSWKGIEIGRDKQLRREPTITTDDIPSWVNKDIVASAVSWFSRQSLHKNKQQQKKTYTVDHISWHVYRIGEDGGVGQQGSVGVEKVCWLLIFVVCSINSRGYRTMVTIRCRQFGSWRNRGDAVQPIEMTAIVWM